MTVTNNSLLNSTQGKRGPEVPNQPIETPLCVMWQGQLLHTARACSGPGDMAGWAIGGECGVGEGPSDRGVAWNGWGVGAAGQRKRVVGMSSATSSLGGCRQHWSHCEPSSSLHPSTLHLSSAHHPAHTSPPQVNTALFIYSPRLTQALFFFRAYRSAAVF